MIEIEGPMLRQRNASFGKAHYQRPMDIEWGKKDGIDGRSTIVQLDQKPYAAKATPKSMAAFTT